MTHLLCVSLVEIKAAKSQICIIDRVGYKIPLIPFTMMTESGYALIYFSFEFNCHIRYEITWYCRRWQSCTLNLSYHAKILGRNPDPKRCSKAASATRQVWTFKKPPTKPYMPWQCKAICSWVPTWNIILGFSMCVCVWRKMQWRSCVAVWAVWTIEVVKILILFCVAVAAASTGFAMCFPREGWFRSGCIMQHPAMIAVWPAATYSATDVPRPSQEVDVQNISIRC